MYLYEPGSYAPVARIDSNPELPEQEASYYYFHTDQIGTPQEMTNTEGQVEWRAYYNKEWGGLEVLSPNVVEQNLRFQGQYHDRKTGLYYNTFRYYDPTVGRFSTQDPIGLMGGENLYQYGLNPLVWVDPLGLKCWNSVRRSYWKAEAKAASKGMYSTTNMLRMRSGLAPRARVKEFHFRMQTVRARNVSLELNHRHWPQRTGRNVDIPYNLGKVTPWKHAENVPFRYPGSKLIEIVQGVGNYKGY
ncbi:RHS repeat domain-containing protein [Pseudomonas sp. Fl4BN1]|uniref:RHS repeat domain-containing protein n=1 Tax=Pseudomonas sp. Fl4BN1 TaxID=2697651 RepID=UPI002114CC73|nr:RHS repeat-associated core domain-containing protein [Pseudomonas sp. Fl4BN1]